MRDFKTSYIQEANENPFSWRIRAGVDRYDIKDNVSYDYVLDGGAGLVRKAGQGGLHGRSQSQSGLCLLFFVFGILLSHGSSL